MTDRSELVKTLVASAVVLLASSGLDQAQPQQQNKQPTPALGQVWAAVVGSEVHPTLSSFGRRDAPPGHPVDLEIRLTKESS